jgi:hypothetical protein
MNWLVSALKRTVFMSGLLGCGDRKRFVAREDEKLTAFLELERVTRNDPDRNQAAPLGLAGF